MQNNNISSSSDKTEFENNEARMYTSVLALAIAQIEKMMNDGDKSINDLSAFFSYVSTSAQAVSSAAANLPDSEEKNIINRKSIVITEMMNSAIVAIQFYDILSQRLSHLSFSLESLYDLIKGPQDPNQLHQFDALKEAIKSKCPFEADREIIDAIFSGIASEDLLGAHLKSKENHEEENNVELF